MASGRFIFGAQDATASGYGWCDDSGVSDIERISGKKPQFYSWDFMNIATPHASLYVEDTKKVRKLTCQAFYEEELFRIVGMQLTRLQAVAFMKREIV